MNVTGSRSFRPISVFDERPFAGPQVVRQLERLARPFRATLHSIEFAVHHEEPPIDDRVGQRQQIVVTKQSRFDFGPSLGIERLATIECRPCPSSVIVLPGSPLLSKNAAQSRYVTGRR